jgi:hypothetical protein
MQFLVVNRRNVESFSETQLAEKIPIQVRRVKELYTEDFIRQIWHRGDRPGGVMLVEADTEATARSILNTLPMVQAGMVEVAMVIPLRPFAGFGPSSA